MQSISVGINKTDNLLLQLKLSFSITEVNLYLTAKEIEKVVNNIDMAKWEERKSIKAGTCLNADVFWCINDNQSISILLGQDDETWEIAFVFPYEVIEKMAKFEQ